jgi:predicted DNA binding CopG/RHH family protein
MKSLNQEEKDLIQSVENAEWISVNNRNVEIEKARKYARNTLIKDQRMNIRIAKRDLHLLKIKAMENGLPYQTLVSSIIHKYLTGMLVDK